MLFILHVICESAKRKQKNIIKTTINPTNLFNRNLFWDENKTVSTSWDTTWPSATSIIIVEFLGWRLENITSSRKVL